MPASASAAVHAPKSSMYVCMRANLLRVLPRVCNVMPLPRYSSPTCVSFMPLPAILQCHACAPHVRQDHEVRGVTVKTLMPGPARHSHTHTHTHTHVCIALSGARGPGSMLAYSVRCGIRRDVACCVCVCAVAPCPAPRGRPHARTHRARLQPARRVGQLTYGRNGKEGGYKIFLPPPPLRSPDSATRTHTHMAHGDTDAPPDATARRLGRRNGQRAQVDKRACPQALSAPCMTCMHMHACIRVACTQSAPRLAPSSVLGPRRRRISHAAAGLFLACPLSPPPRSYTHVHTHTRTLHGRRGRPPAAR